MSISTEKLLVSEKYSDVLTMGAGSGMNGRKMR